MQDVRRQTDYKQLSYTMNDLNKLSADLVPYLASQEETAEYIIFHGELSPWSNFDRSPFVLNGQQYHSTEQWIQFQKVMLFGIPTLQTRYSKVKPHVSTRS